MAGVLLLPFICIFAATASQTNGPTNNLLTAQLAKLPRLEGFTICVEPPFIVIGDEAAEVVNRRATGTVRWAAARLKKDFFPRDPADPINIWLFRDRHSYTNHAWLFFKDQPTTPFGYYSEDNRALVMNIATGGGTLVHEMTHAFMRANFPQCPAWFNEGFASLFEASAEKNGHIVGLINWRYKNLEAAIRERRTISFHELTSKTGADFYAGKTYREHYAQARYLCFYLQEKGLLLKFYREFQKNIETDPTGYHTLAHTLGDPNMATFQADWEKFILNLRPR